jgi:tetratricopeptide (TPR) repeat protein
MKSNAVYTVVLAAACGLGGGLAGARFFGAQPPQAAAAVAPGGDASAELARLAERQAAAERDLEALRVSIADLESAAHRTRAARADDGAALERAPEQAAGTPAATGGADDARDAFERLLAGELAWDEAQAAWQAIEKAGRLDELVAALEERARARGNDPDAQTELGKAYLQKTFRAGGGPEAGVWATKADQAFDAALKIDDHHWESRFQKAVSLSFWPPMLGKQPDAVKQFETLVAQQEASGSTHPGYAQTYLFLGNMHLQMGAKDKALAAWQKGAHLFPDHAELAQKLADVQ